MPASLNAIEFDPIISYLSLQFFLFLVSVINVASPPVKPNTAECEKLFTIAQM